jgi:hypothetical protein
MKAYILTEKDLQSLKDRIDKDPRHGYGGSSQILSESDTRIYEEAHRFYNYQICKWIEEIKKE